IFFVAPDSTTARGDDYILFEQVNGGPPDMVSRNIIGSPTTVYFDYYRLASVAGTLSIDSLPAARLPLVHTVPIHLAPADTGAAAVIDSIRGIRVTFTVTNGLSGAAERRYTLVRITDLTWGTPYLSLPAGSPTYLYDDAAVTSGATYQYQLAAADCTPSSSPTTTSAAVTIP